MSKYNNNIPTQNNRDRDYLKELIGIKKEIDKIYKQLSKDETFTDILDTIKTDFINENITIIEDNLSNPNLTNYKDFNAKIIKILNIFIKILEKFILEVDDNKYKNVADIYNFTANTRDVMDILGFQLPVIDLFDSVQFKDDLIGLKTLWQTGRLNIFQTNCTHAGHKTEACFPQMENLTFPFLF